MISKAHDRGENVGKVCHAYKHIESCKNQKHEKFEYMSFGCIAGLSYSSFEGGHASEYLLLVPRPSEYEFI
jgi:hypothetical protein